MSPDDPPPTRTTSRYSPATLLVDVVHLLHARGLTSINPCESVALRASTTLLHSIGIQPDPLPAWPVRHGPVVQAAAILLRAAGIEPDAIGRWPQT